MLLLSKERSPSLHRNLRRLLHRTPLDKLSPQEQIGLRQPGMKTQRWSSSTRFVHVRSSSWCDLAVCQYLLLPMATVSSLRELFRESEKVAAVVAAQRVVGSTHL